MGRDSTTLNSSIKDYLISLKLALTFPSPLQLLPPLVVVQTSFAATVDLPGPAQFKTLGGPLCEMHQ